MTNFIYIIHLDPSYREAYVKEVWEIKSTKMEHARFEHKIKFKIYRKQIFGGYL